MAATTEEVPRPYGRGTSSVVSFVVAMNRVDVVELVVDLVDVDSGNSCIMNPDGTIGRVDSDESSYTSATSKRSQNKFVPPSVGGTTTETAPADTAVPTPGAKEENALV